ncbi:MAG: polymer-forming cytoskeletal protein [Caldilineaceae bacterium]|nr:polymer-forming cytoskeletal protein [Caldilineaceae bacterium]
MQFFKRDKKDEQDEEPIYQEPSPLVERAKAALAQNEPSEEEMQQPQEPANDRPLPSPTESVPPPPRFLESPAAPRPTESVQKEKEATSPPLASAPRRPEPAPQMPEPTPRFPEPAQRMQEPQRRPESAPQMPEPPRPSESAPQPRFDPTPQRPERLPVSQGKWNPEGERRAMNPVPRERLPYPDLPMQPQERERDRERERERPISRSTQQSAPSPRTVISKESNFNGNVRSDGDILIEGSFEGEIDCKGTVIVAEGANVSATVRARNATIAGSANGDFSCEERLTIEASGEMRGKAQAPTLVVDEGAFFEGEFKMGAGGFSSVSSNLSSWQSGRSGGTRPATSSAPSTDEEGDD